MKTPSTPLPRATIDGSVTRHKELIPIDRETQAPWNEQPWRGPELNACCATRSMWGGPHWILTMGVRKETVRQLGQKQPPNTPINIISRFIAYLYDDKSPIPREEAELIAQTMLDLLNINRQK